MRLRYNDQQHAYWFDAGNGWKRCKGVTSVAKVPDDLYRLQQWEKRQVLLGAALKPTLLDRVAAHVDDRDILDQIAEEAKQAAGANEASARGSAAHRITESHDEGGRIVPTDLASWVVTNWRAALDAAGLEVVATERIAVHPDLMIAGRFDRVVRDATGRLVVLDLKTGARAIAYPHAIAVQLALYANAPLWCEIKGSGETDTLEPAPEVVKDVAYVVHMPADGEVVVAEVDIAAGWDCFQSVILPTYAWRARKDLVGKTTAAHVAPPSATEVDAAWSEAGAVDERPDPAPVLERIAWGKQHGDGFARRLAERWALDLGDVPTPGKLNGGRWTAAQVERIGAVLTATEVDCGTPFGDVPVTVPEPRQRQGLPRDGMEATLHLLPVEEGPEADPEALAALRAAVDGLAPTAKAALGSLTSAALSAGVDFRPSVTPSVRRFELGRAAVAVAECLEADDDATRAALFLVTGREYAPYAPLGALVGALTIDEARRLEQIVRAIGTGYRLDVTLDGPRLVPVAA